MLLEKRLVIKRKLQSSVYTNSKQETTKSKTFNQSINKVKTLIVPYNKTETYLIFNGRLHSALPQHFILSQETNETKSK